jgi:putative DNA primase/helicase
MSQSTDYPTPEQQPLEAASRAIRRLMYGQPPNLNNGTPYGAYLPKLTLPTMQFLDGGAASVVRLWETLRNDDQELTAAVEGRLTRVSDPSQLQCTDFGNAERLVLRYGQDVRFCYPANSWFIWNGQRWGEDTTGEVIRRAKATVQGLYAEASDAPTRERREELGKWAVRSEAEARINAMITLAQSEPGVPILPAAFDRDPWLLNCLNGVVDLRTGQLRPHRREDFMTKLAPVTYNRQARSVLWDTFLARILPDRELRDFVQRATGYSATGDTREEVLFFPHGPTATGKSTFLAAIAATLGDYAATADFETFLRRERLAGGPRNDIARLVGRRFVVSLEVDDGKHLAEALIKQITGGDVVTARFLHKESFEFVPQLKLWLAANDRPLVRDDDDAIWRRILQVPFTTQIPKGDQDPTVKARLRNPAEPGAAILAWIVQGCLDWQHKGLEVPAAVRNTTAAYRKEMDPLGEFLAECCTQDPKARVRKTALWAAYQDWAKPGGGRRLGRNKFTERRRQRGCDEWSDGNARFWLGVGLLTERQEPER